MLLGNNKSKETLSKLLFDTILKEKWKWNMKIQGRGERLEVDGREK